VGCGFAAGAYHLPAQQALPDFVTVAVADPNSEAAEQAAAKFDVPAAYADYAAMMDTEALDCVSVCVPAELHLEVTEAAASRGIHVFCEKPMASSRSEVQQILDIVEKAKIKFMIAANFWWYPDLVDAKRQIDAGLIGDVFHIRIEEFINEFQPGDHRFDRYLFMEMGVHYVDIIRHLAGSNVSRVHASLLHVPTQDRLGENFATATLELENGVIARVDECWCAARGAQYVMRIRVDGTEGAVYINEADHPYKIYTDRGDAGEWIYPPSKTQLPAGHEGAFAAPWPVDELVQGEIGAYKAFADYLATDSLPPTSAGEYAKTMDAVFGVYESAHSGQVIELGGVSNRNS
jgi:predicted dehydrogenase